MKGSELLTWTKWELVQLIKKLCEGRSAREVREIVDQVRHELRERERAYRFSPPESE